MSTDATTGSRTWAAHLDALESAVAGAHAALCDASPDTPVAVDEQALLTSTPQHPLSPADAPRAQSLLHDLHELVAELQVARSRVVRELQLHRRLAAARTQDTGARYLDGRC